MKNETKASLLETQGAPSLPQRATRNVKNTKIPFKKKQYGGFPSTQRKTDKTAELPSPVDLVQSNLFIMRSHPKYKIPSLNLIFTTC